MRQHNVMRYLIFLYSIDSLYLLLYHSKKRKKFPKSKDNDMIIFFFYKGFLKCQNLLFEYSLNVNNKISFEISYSMKKIIR